MLQWSFLTLGFLRSYIYYVSPELSNQLQLLLDFLTCSQVCLGFLLGFTFTSCLGNLPSIFSTKMLNQGLDLLSTSQCLPPGPQGFIKEEEGQYTAGESTRL